MRITSMYVYEFGNTYFLFYDVNLQHWHYIALHNDLPDRKLSGLKICSVLVAVF